MSDGDHVQASGRIVSGLFGDWFDAPGWSFGVMLRTPQSVALPGPHARRLVGIDLDAMDDPYELDGVREGHASLRGQLVNGVLRVTQQLPYGQFVSAPWSAWTSPPCQPPPEGWPLDALSDEPHIDLESEDLPGFVNVTIFRPTPTQSVYVVAATEPEGVDRVLRARIGARLCVTPSVFTRDDIDRATTELERHRQDWGLDSILHSSDESGQAIVVITLPVVTQEIAEQLSRQPQGLIQARPWLMPVAAHP